MTDEHQNMTIGMAFIAVIAMGCAAIHHTITKRPLWSPPHAETAIRIVWVGELEQEWKDHPRVFWLAPKPNEKLNCTGRYSRIDLHGRCVAGEAWMGANAINVVFPRDGSGRFSESALAHELAHMAGITHDEMEASGVVRKAKALLRKWEAKVREGSP